MITGKSSRLTSNGFKSAYQRERRRCILELLSANGGHAAETTLRSFLGSRGFLSVSIDTLRNDLRALRDGNRITIAKIKLAIEGRPGNLWFVRLTHVALKRGNNAALVTADFGGRRAIAAPSP